MIVEIQNLIRTTGGDLSIQELLRRYSGEIPATESELRAAIRWGVSNGFFETRVPTNGADPIISVTEKCLPSSRNAALEVVLSVPQFTEMGMERTIIRHSMLETREAFRKVISEARYVLRISSPFTEDNVLSAQGLPDLQELIRFTFEKGCEIRILSREIRGRRLGEVKWIKDLASAEGHEAKLKMFDYHHLSADSRLISSTHAKLIIADNRLAYVGSAELRRGSLLNNFEVGCLVRGPVVSSLCEAFDLMTNYAVRVP